MSLFKPLSMARALSAVPGWQFSRASSATALIGGQVTTFGDDVPRITDQGLLIEGAATNLLTHSEDFTNTAWTKYSSASVSANQATAPNGDATADLIDLSADALARVLGLAYVETNTALVATVWLRAVSGSGTYPISVYDGAVAGRGVNAPLSEEWRRFSIAFTASDVYEGGGGPGLYVGNRRDGTGVPSLTQAYVWGAQFETGSAATSYIPTRGEAASRAADLARITTAKPLSAILDDNSVVTLAPSDGAVTLPAGQIQRVHDGALL